MSTNPEMDRLNQRLMQLGITGSEAEADRETLRNTGDLPPHLRAKYLLPRNGPITDPLKDNEYRGINERDGWAEFNNTTALDRTVRGNNHAYNPWDGHRLDTGTVARSPYPQVNPDTGQLESRSFGVTDPDSGNIYRGSGPMVNPDTGQVDSPSPYPPVSHDYG